MSLSGTLSGVVFLRNANAPSKPGLDFMGAHQEANGTMLYLIRFDNVSISSGCTDPSGSGPMLSKRL
jgi:hypothetical protein